MRNLPLNTYTLLAVVRRVSFSLIYTLDLVIERHKVHQGQGCVFFHLSGVVRRDKHPVLHWRGNHLYPFCHITLFALLINSQCSLPLTGGSFPSALPDETRDTLNTETYFPVFGLRCLFNLIWAVRKGALVWLKTERDLSELFWGWVRHGSEQTWICAGRPWWKRDKPCRKSLPHRQMERTITQLSSRVAGMLFH